MQDHQKIQWTFLYRLGAIAALAAVFFGVLEITINFVPGAMPAPDTAVNWFALYQRSPFLGLRNMGLINLLLNTSAILAYPGLLAAHRHNRRYPLAFLAALLAWIGIAVFFAANRALPMLALSQQYAAAGAERQVLLAAAGETMLAVGGSHTAGSFIGFALVECAGFLMSLAMLRGRIFGAINAWAGMVGFGLLLVFEFFTSFIGGLTGATMGLAMIGGLSTMLWYVLSARRLLQLAKNETA